MKVGFWGYFILVLGVSGVTVAMLFQDVTETNDQNYYLLKEVTEAAMLDSVDLVYYAVSDGEIAIDKEKFVENFIRRFSQSAGLNKTYDIKFYDINEMPPKVSVSVGAKSNVFSFTGEQFNIVNKLDAILETRN